MHVRTHKNNNNNNIAMSTTYKIINVINNLV